MEKAVVVVSKAGEYLVDPTIKQVRCLFCFNDLVEDLNEEEKRLELAQIQLEEQVEGDINNFLMIENDVKNWLADARIILTEVSRLKEEIQENKTGVNEWYHNWGWRYQLSRKSAKKISIMLKLRNSRNFTGRGYRASLRGLEFPAPKDFQFESTKAALDHIMETLKNDKTHVVILYGMEGAGKTTLVEAVHKKVQEEDIFDKVVMAVVSRTPNFRNIQCRLADLLNLKLKEESEEQRAKRLSLRFSDTENKILIILDDVWEVFDFKDKIGIPLGKYCKILLTTRCRNICTTREGQSVVPLNALDKDEGVALLKRHAGIADELPELNDLAVKIAGECLGLPLRLVTIGSALREQEIEEWEVVHQKLKKSKLENMHNVTTTEGSYASLILSYDYLKGENCKLCFLLCSLFPEDYKIPFEDLVRYAMGLDLYQDGNSIEDVRTELHSTLDYLKASCLLLETGEEEFVKMHDMVRDAALWITFKEKKAFMSKTGMGLEEWSEEKNWEQYMAIYLMDIKIEWLSIRLVCPKLEILVLGGVKYKNSLKVSDECFKEMKALKVIRLSCMEVSLKSLKFVIYLKTLELLDCNLRDISSLAKLNKLEILSFRGSTLDELPRELSELRKLRMLDLRDCSQLEIIHSGVIRSLSQLEELYIGDSFKEWEVEGMNTCRINASLSELNYLSKLVVLVLETNAKCLPDDFDVVCYNLQRYDIRVNTSCGFYVSKSNKKVLRNSESEVTCMTVFKALYQTLECLCLKNTICQNILPSFDKGGLNMLSSLELEDCYHLKCIIAKSQQEVLATAFSDLMKLSLIRLIHLREICCDGRVPMGFLEKLESICVDGCPNLCSLFPAMLLQRLNKLKEVIILSCNKLEEVFQLDGLCHTGEENLMLLPNLAKLKLEELPELTCIWKGPIRHVNLQSLTNIEVTNCKSLTYLFTLSLARSLVQLKSLEVTNCESLQLLVTEKEENDKEEEILSKHDHVIQYLFFSKLESLRIQTCKRLEYIFPVYMARSLVQLKKLTIENVSQLKQVFYLDCREENVVDAGEEKDIMLPKLRELTLSKLSNLISFCPENYHSTWPALGKFTIYQCSNLSMHFIAEVVGKVQHTEERLRTLQMGSLNDLCYGILSLWRYGFFKNLENLRISNCGVKEIFQLEGLVVYGQQHILSLPNLKKLELNCLDELEGLYKGPIHILSLQNLTILGISSCNRLRNIFSPTLAQNFLHLQELNVSDCKELEQIIDEDDEEDHLQSLILFPNLLQIIVERCHKLKRLLPIMLATRGFKQLEDINVSDSFELEKVFGHKDRADIINNEKIVLPQLGSLSLKALPRLTNFCPTGSYFIFPSLNILMVEECPKCPKITTRFYFPQDDCVHAEAEKLRISCNQFYDGIFSRLVNGFFQNLEELKIDNCGVKVIFQQEGFVIDGQQLKLLIPKLKRVELNYLEELEGFCKGPGDILCLHYLTTLRISHCSRLRNIFSPALARNLCYLEKLYLGYCKELEQIIVEDDEKVHILPEFLGITVERCHKLKRLFPITVARGLPKLKEINVIKCTQLEEVFGHNDGVEFMGDKEIILPQLVSLSLNALPSLTNFCSVGFHFIFPSLKILMVEQCHKIATRFSFAYDQCVHAKAMALEIGMEFKDENLSPLGLYNEPSIGIRCHSPFELEAKLSPYKETLLTSSSYP